MSHSETPETPAGPFRDGRLTDLEDSPDTRPTRVNTGRQEAGRQDAGGQDDPGQTRATPVYPKPSPERRAVDPQGLTQAHPVHDPHGQTQGRPGQAGETRAISPRSDQPQHAGPNRQAPSSQPPRPKPPASLEQFVRRNWLWGLLAVLLFGGMIAAGGYGGLLSGQAEQRALAEAAAVTDLTEQVSLGMEDLQAGRYDVARQRFEFVLYQDPNFPGAADGLVQALQVLNATATPSPPPAPPTLTPTRDLRPVAELLAQAVGQLNNNDWDGAIDTLNALRKEDPEYQVTRVDGYIYLALRYRGIYKITNLSNLEGGIYDLSLAEQFGPLDTEALGARNLARLYIIGSSFWEVMPDQAVYYFSQVAAAAPYLRDASGWTARERYRLSLVQYGDQLAASENWCEAQVQYEIALDMQADAAIGEKALQAALMCSPPTETPTITPTGTMTATLTLSPTPTFPVATTPVVTTPVATTPAATTPAVTTPAATTPVATTPAATTPVATTPVATTPAATTPPPDIPSPTPSPTETSAAASAGLTPIGVTTESSPPGAIPTPQETPDTATPTPTPAGSSQATASLVGLLPIGMTVWLKLVSKRMFNA